MRDFEDARVLFLGLKGKECKNKLLRGMNGQDKGKRTLRGESMLSERDVRLRAL